MKINKYTHTILYTHNSFKNSNYPNIEIVNLFGSLAKIKYNHDIIWVPENRNNNIRLLRMLPQYKFGFAESDTVWLDALPSTIDHTINGSDNLVKNITVLAQMENYEDYTDNIFITIDSQILNDTTVIINNSISNYSTILSQDETSIFYNMSFRLKLEIYNQTLDVVEDSVFTYYTDIRFGRSFVQNVGDPPILPWDKDPDGNLFPPISKVTETVSVCDGQGGYLSPLALFIP
jgi:hypothetical protein